MTNPQGKEKKEKTSNYLSASEMGKKSWEIRKKKYGKNFMKNVRKGGKFDKRLKAVV